MATADRFGEAADERPVRPRSFSLAWMSNVVTWFALATLGMITVFIGLAIDAYRHNNSAAEETLLSFGNPGHLIAGIGIVVATGAVLAGLSVATLRGTETAQQAIRRFVPVTGAWVATASIAIASLTYLGVSGTTVGHGGHNADQSVVAGAVDHESMTAAEHAASTSGVSDAGVADALKDEGIIDESGGGNGVNVLDNGDPSSIPGALTQGASGQADGRHDHGKHATFSQVQSMEASQLVSLFPAEVVNASDIPALKEQILQVRAIAEKYPTEAAANAGGYINTTSDVPFMGKHFLNFDYVRDGIFDPAKPEGLLFSKIDGGEPKLVGIWFLLVPGVGDVTKAVEPEGFTSDLDLWHAHIGLCLVGTSGASEGETKESCEAKGGNFTADLRWMMHVWVAPEATENPEGVFAYLNQDLYEKQVAAKEAAQPAAPSGAIAQ